ncbi:hypothetical protein K1719_006348 [Acacia pycnantha]|nr:hypothetical protein K1719_006348 [Acacia pycnantha]
MLAPIHRGRLPRDIIHRSISPRKVKQETGRLRFCWSNVCLRMFTLDFLNQVANGLEKDSIYHFAEKKIPSINGFTMGLKLEQFIFDAFPYAPTTALLRYYGKKNLHQ